MKGGLRSGTLTPRNYSGITGIKNLGNTCFLNVVLQSLMSLRSFHVYLHGEAATPHTPLARALSDSMKYLAKPLSPSYDPTPMVTAVPVLQNTFARGQHDPEELLHHLMAILDDEKGAKETNKAKEEERGGSTTASSAEKEWDREEEEERESVRRTRAVDENPFYGCLASDIACKACNNKRSQTHKFIDISLSIPASTRPTLQNCLNLFTQSETLNGVRCDRCLDARRERRRQVLDQLDQLSPLARVPKTSEQSLCGPNVRPFPLDWPKGSSRLREELGKRGIPIIETPIIASVDKWTTAVKSEAEKKLFIKKTPRALCLHIQRLVAQAGFREPTYVKKDDNVAFPLNLDLAPFCNNTTPKAIFYSLVAVIVHHGSEDGGHFTVYRKLFSKDTQRLASEDYAQFLRHAGRAMYEERDWVHISDEVCQRVSEEKVLNAPAYMLFYEKTSTPSA